MMCCRCGCIFKRIKKKGATRCIAKVCPSCKRKSMEERVWVHRNPISIFQLYRG